jgi:proteic killer suppression protein
MRIGSVVNKGLRRFVERDDASGLPPGSVEKIRNMLSYLQEMSGVDELRHLPHWRAHRLTGGRKGVWSLTVTRNWRMTFRVDEAEGAIVDLDFEDYH